jgi:hypothetical protein
MVRLDVRALPPLIGWQTKKHPDRRGVFYAGDAYGMSLSSIALSRTAPLSALVASKA